MISASAGIYRRVAHLEEKTMAEQNAAYTRIGSRQLQMAFPPQRQANRLRNLGMGLQKPVSRSFVSGSSGFEAMQSEMAGGLGGCERVKNGRIILTRPGLAFL